MFSFVSLFRLPNKSAKLENTEKDKRAAWIWRGIYPIPSDNESMCNIFCMVAIAKPVQHQKESTRTSSGQVQVPLTSKHRIESLLKHIMAAIPCSIYGATSFLTSPGDEQRRESKQSTSQYYSSTIGASSATRSLSHMTDIFVPTKHAGHELLLGR